MKKDRINTIDTLKTFSIFMVIFCHNPLLPEQSIIGNILMLLSWVAVPCFMMASGVLVGRKANADISWCIKKIAIIFIGIVAWRFIYLFLQMISFGVRYSLSDILQCIIFFKELDGIKIGVTWYMQSYILVISLTPIISFLYHQGKKQLLVYIMAILFIQSILIPDLSFWIEQLSNRKNIQLPELSGFLYMMPFNSSANMLFYFIFGIICYEYKNEILKFVNKVKLYLILGLGLLCLVFTIYVESGTIGWIGTSLSYGYNRVGTCIMAFAAFVLICFYQHPKCVEKIGGIFGSNTLGIYYFHYLMLIFISHYFYSYFEPYSCVLLNIIKTVVIMIMANFITIIVKKIPVLKKIV